jgi:hypothetical protein
VVSLPDRVCRPPVQSPRTPEVGSAFCGPDRVRTNRNAHAMAAACAIHLCEARARLQCYGPVTADQCRASNHETHEENQIERESHAEIGGREGQQSSKSRSAASRSSTWTSP